MRCNRSSTSAVWPRATANRAYRIFENAYNAVRTQAIMRAVTDSRPTIDFAEGLAPGVDNLFTILECLTKTSREQSQNQFDGAQYGTLKGAVADVVVERLTDIQRRQG